MSAEINFNANIITWAIARAGYELQEFAQVFPKVTDWLAKTKTPTLKQLEAFARKVHIPFGYLFLPEPPAEPLPFPFFRTGKDPAGRLHVNVYDTLLLLQQRQEWLKEYLEASDVEPLPFVGKFAQSQDVAAIVADIRQTLGLDPAWASHHATWEAALEFLSRRIEAAGIIMVFNGVVENNTSRSIPVEVCRGFVMVDERAPFMFINNGDAKAAQMFTIVHELAHIWTGQSVGFDLNQLLPANDPLEKLCDRVAAEFLVPQDLFLEKWTQTPDIQRLARFFKVSPIVIARRALDTAKISKPAFFAFYNEYVGSLKAKKEAQTSGGGDFYATSNKRISVAFARHVEQALRTNKILYRDAFRLTGLRGETFNTFYKKLNQN